MGTNTSCVGTPAPRPISNPARLASASARIAAAHLTSETCPSPHQAIAKVTAHDEEAGGHDGADDRLAQLGRAARA